MSNILLADFQDSVQEKCKFIKIRAKRVIK